MKKFVVDPLFFSANYKKDINSYKRMMEMIRNVYGIVYDCKFQTLMYDGKPVLTMFFRIN